MATSKTKKPVIKTRGLYPHRFRDNPEEKAFAEAWVLSQLTGAHPRQRNGTTCCCRVQFCQKSGQTI